VCNASTTHTLKEEFWVERFWMMENSVIIAVIANRTIKVNKTFNVGM
jgi:hypothetical protein